MGIHFYRDAQLPLFEIKSCDSGMHASRKHVHEEFSLGIITKGASIITVADKEYSVGIGTAILIDPGVIHQCRPYNLRNWGFIMLYLNRDWVDSITDGSCREAHVSIKNLSDAEFGQVVGWCDVLHEPRSGMEKETSLISMLDLILNRKNLIEFEFMIDSSPMEAVRKVRDFIHERFLEKISLDDLAHVSGISKYHMIRLFNAVFGIQPHAYQTMLRINYAKNELAKSGHDITTIAQNAGFYDQSHLIKMFKMYYGTTPVNYRHGE